MLIGFLEANQRVLNTKGRTMIRAEDFDIVTIEYCVNLIGGDSILSSEKDGPLTFQVGFFRLIKGLNAAVVGMKVGQSKRVSMLPSNAFGIIEEKLIKTVNIKDLPRFSLLGKRVIKKDDSHFSTILKMDSKKGTALIDGNHLLAGMALEFSITIINIIKAQSNSSSGYLYFKSRLIGGRKLGYSGA